MLRFSALNFPLSELSQNDDCQHSQRQVMQNIAVQMYAKNSDKPVPSFFA